jgi:hypothetical protein
MDEDDSAAEEILNQINNEYQFPRLLSSRRLLDLEVSKLAVHNEYMADVFCFRWKMLGLEEV